MSVGFVILGLSTAPWWGERVAYARAQYESQYGFDRTWTTAVRFLRVDRGWKIVEKDDASGYIMFEYTSPESGDRKLPASFELVRDSENVKVVVQIREMPSYHEHALINAFANKLRDELGDPPKRKKVPPVVPGDAGAEGSPP